MAGGEPGSGTRVPSDVAGLPLVVGVSGAAMGAQLKRFPAFIAIAATLICHRWLAE
ncbi:hypothetical protein ACFCZT_07930 [Streptomyces sp. NPDC056230]|uniref:hypothetical protein n=1 Tax=Streptomyces sp. NPDC056230 TaxID=3345754 RepID=UPI0035DF4D94